MKEKLFCSNFLIKILYDRKRKSIETNWKHSILFHRNERNERNDRKNRSFKLHTSSIKPFGCCELLVSVARNFWCDKFERFWNFVKFLLCYNMLCCNIVIPKFEVFLMLMVATWSMVVRQTFGCMLLCIVYCSNLNRSKAFIFSTFQCFWQPRNFFLAAFYLASSKISPQHKFFSIW